MKIIGLLSTSILSVFTMFLAMSSMVRVNNPLDENINNGEGYYQNYSQFRTEIYMPNKASDNYKSNVSFFNEYTLPFYGQFICMCCDSNTPKPKYKSDGKQVIFEGFSALNREEIAILFNAI